MMYTGQYICEVMTNSLQFYVAVYNKALRAMSTKKSFGNKHYMEYLVMSDFSRRPVQYGFLDGSHEHGTWERVMNEHARLLRNTITIT